MPTAPSAALPEYSAPSPTAPGAVTGGYSAPTPPTPSAATAEHSPGSPTAPSVVTPGYSAPTPPTPSAATAEHSPGSPTAPGAGLPAYSSPTPEAPESVLGESEPPPEGAPVNTVAPVLDATIDGNDVGTFTASPGTWSGDAPITYSYQWRKNGVNIATATDASYLFYTLGVIADSLEPGDEVDCLVTATNASGAATAATNDYIMTIYGMTAPP